MYASGFRLIVIYDPVAKTRYAVDASDMLESAVFEEAAEGMFVDGTGAEQSLQRVTRLDLPVTTWTGSVQIGAWQANETPLHAIAVGIDGMFVQWYEGAQLVQTIRRGSALEPVHKVLRMATHLRVPAVYQTPDLLEHLSSWDGDERITFPASGIRLRASGSGTVTIYAQNSAGAQLATASGAGQATLMLPTNTWYVRVVSTAKPQLVAAF